MQQSGRALCLSLLLTAGVPYSVAAQAVNTDSSSSNAAADLKISPRFGIGYTTSGAGFDGFTRFDAFIPILQTPGSRLTFVEGRLLLDNDTNFGGNLVLGHRFYSSSRIFGGYLAYDSRDTGSSRFHQLGAGVESLGEIWDFRANAYLPIGDTRQQVGFSRSSSDPIFTDPVFAGNALLFPGQQEHLEFRQYEAALGGVDVEVGARIARLGTTGDLRGYGGVYYYDGSGSDGTFGWRTRLEARPSSTLRLGLSLQHDGIFGTNFVVSLGASFPGNRNPEPIRRLGESVARQENILVDEQAESEISVEEFTLTATNPDTNAPYHFQHVKLGATGGDGTFEQPFGEVRGALEATAAGEIVYVQTGSNPGIPAFGIPDGVAVLSVAPPQTIDTVEFSRVELPLSGSGDFPEVRGTVTLGNETTLAGFAMTDVPGNGIQGAGIRDVTIRDNRVIRARERGINLENASGTIARNAIANSTLEGIRIGAFNDTQQQITLAENTVTDSGNQGILLQSTDRAQQMVNLQDNAIARSSFEGIFAQAFNNAQQTVTLESDRISESGNQGVRLQGTDSARQEFTVQNTAIANSRLEGVLAEAFNSAQQQFNLEAAQITDSANQGIRVEGFDTAQQNFVLGRSTVSNSGLEGIRTAAFNDSQQRFTLAENTIRDSQNQGILVQATDRGEQDFTLQGNAIASSGFEGVYIQGFNDSRQSFAIEETQISESGNQGIRIEAFNNSQQEFVLRGSAIVESNLEGARIAARDDSQQQFTLEGNQVAGSGNQGIRIEAIGNSRQEFSLRENAIANNTEEGIFILTGNAAQQDITLNSNTITGNGFEGIFLENADNAQIAANVRFNILRENAIPGTPSFTANTNSTQKFCLDLQGNDSDTGFRLRQNTGIFQVVNRDNVGANNTGTVELVGSFENVSACP
jgi:parallel beta-helix repeat protein